MEAFTDIYSKRQQQPGWYVGQADILLSEARTKKCTSLVIYAALELRMAIEQLLFAIVCVGKGSIDETTLTDCRKKDGLFRALKEVNKNYTLKCKFSNLISKAGMGPPEIAEWDVRKLKRYFTEVSDLCHSQLIISDFEEDIEMWKKKVFHLLEVKDFLVENMKKKTGVLELDNAVPEIKKLWEKFISKEFSEEEVFIQLRKYRESQPDAGGDRAR